MGFLFFMANSFVPLKLRIISIVLSLFLLLISFYFYPSRFGFFPLGFPPSPSERAWGEADEADEVKL
jgi:hypothetical protein